MYGRVRIEFGRQKSQNSISTGRPRCWSMRRVATLTQGSLGGNGGAWMWSAGARTAGDGSAQARGGSGLDEAAPDRVANQLDPIAHAELAQHVGPVRLDRLLRDVQRQGDLGVGVRLGDQLHDLFL